MKASFFITLLLVKSLFIDPTNAALAYKHEWDCINKVLFNHEVMSVLLAMDESDCENGLPDPHQLFKDIHVGPDDQDADPEQELEEHVSEIPLSYENLGLSKSSNQNGDLPYEDMKHNGLLDSLSLDYIENLSSDNNSYKLESPGQFQELVLSDTYQVTRKIMKQEKRVFQVEGLEESETNSQISGQNPAKSQTSGLGNPEMVIQDSGLGQDISNSESNSKSSIKQAGKIIIDTGKTTGINQEGVNLEIVNQNTEEIEHSLKNSEQDGEDSEMEFSDISFNFNNNLDIIKPEFREEKLNDIKVYEVDTKPAEIRRKVSTPKSDLEKSDSPSKHSELEEDTNLQLSGNNSDDITVTTKTQNNHYEIPQVELDIEQKEEQETHKSIKESETSDDDFDLEFSDIKFDFNHKLDLEKPEFRKNELNEIKVLEIETIPAEIRRRTKTKLPDSVDQISASKESEMELSNEEELPEINKLVNSSSVSGAKETESLSKSSIVENPDIQVSIKKSEEENLHKSVKELESSSHSNDDDDFELSDITFDIPTNLNVEKHEFKEGKLNEIKFREFETIPAEIKKKVSVAEQPKLEMSELDQSLQSSNDSETLGEEQDLEGSQSSQKSIDSSVESIIKSSESQPEVNVSIQKSEEQVIDKSIKQSEHNDDDEMEFSDISFNLNNNLDLIKPEFKEGKLNEIVYHEVDTIPAPIKKKTKTEEPEINNSQIDSSVSETDSLIGSNLDKSEIQNVDNISNSHKDSIITSNIDQSEESDINNISNSQKDSLISSNLDKSEIQTINNISNSHKDSIIASNLDQSEIQDTDNLSISKKDTIIKSDLVKSEESDKNNLSISEKDSIIYSNLDQSEESDNNDISISKKDSIIKSNLDQSEIPDNNFISISKKDSIDESNLDQSEIQDNNVSIVKSSEDDKIHSIEKSGPVVDVNINKSEHETIEKCIKHSEEDNDTDFELSDIVFDLNPNLNIEKHEFKEGKLNEIKIQDVITIPTEIKKKSQTISLEKSEVPSIAKSETQEIENPLIGSIISSNDSESLDLSASNTSQETNNEDLTQVDFDLNSSSESNGLKTPEVEVKINKSEEKLINKSIAHSETSDDDEMEFSDIKLDLNTNLNLEKPEFKEGKLNEIKVLEVETIPAEIKKRPTSIQQSSSSDENLDASLASSLSSSLSSSGESELENELEKSNLDTSILSNSNNSIQSSTESEEDPIANVDVNVDRVEVKTIDKSIKESEKDSEDSALELSDIQIELDKSLDLEKPELREETPSTIIVKEFDTIPNPIKKKTSVLDESELINSIESSKDSLESSGLSTSDHNNIQESEELVKSVESIDTVQPKIADIQVNVKKEVQESIEKSIRQSEESNHDDDEMEFSDIKFDLNPALNIDKPEFREEKGNQILIKEVNTIPTEIKRKTSIPELIPSEIKNSSDLENSDSVENLNSSVKTVSLIESDISNSIDSSLTDSRKSLIDSETSPIIINSKHSSKFDNSLDESFNTLKNTEIPDTIQESIVSEDLNDSIDKSTVSVVEKPSIKLSIHKSEQENINKSINESENNEGSEMEFSDIDIQIKNLDIDKNEFNIKELGPVTNKEVHTTPVTLKKSETPDQDLIDLDIKKTEIKDSEHKIIESVTENGEDSELDLPDITFSTDKLDLSKSHEFNIKKLPEIKDNGITTIINQKPKVSESKISESGLDKTNTDILDDISLTHSDTPENLSKTKENPSVDKFVKPQHVSESEIELSKNEIVTPHIDINHSVEDLEKTEIKKIDQSLLKESTPIIQNSVIESKESLKDSEISKSSSSEDSDLIKPVIKSIENKKVTNSIEDKSEIISSFGSDQTDINSSQDSSMIISEIPENFKISSKSASESHKSSISDISQPDLSQSSHTSDNSSIKSDSDIDIEKISDPLGESIKQSNFLPELSIHSKSDSVESILHSLITPDQVEFDNKKFVEQPTPALIMSSVLDNKPKGGKGTGRTLFAHRTIQQRLLPTSKPKTQGDVIAKAFGSFKLLHKCVQRALEMCSPNFEKLRETCEKANGAKCSISDFSAKLQCAEGEDLINNACYKKCPEGFRDYKLFCLKPEYIKRPVQAFTGQNLKQNEEVWGDSLVVKRCSEFGRYFVHAGPDLCRAKCPAGYLDRGLFCQKPRRFHNQQVHFFDKNTAIHK